MPLLKVWSFAPHTICTRERTISMSPNEAITRMIVEPWRSGRKNSRSIPRTASAVRAMATGRKRRGWAPVSAVRVRVK